MPPPGNIGSGGTIITESEPVITRSGIRNAVCAASDLLSLWALRTIVTRKSKSTKTRRHLSGSVIYVGAIIA